MTARSSVTIVKVWVTRGSQQVAKLPRPCPGVVCLGGEEVTTLKVDGDTCLCGTFVELRRDPSIIFGHSAGI